MAELFHIVRRLRRLIKYGFVSQRPKSPNILTFNVTTKCNMSCRHCMDDCWGNPHEDLSFKEIETVSKELGQIEEVGFGGGEPFLRDDLVEIYELFVKKNGVRTITIPSNGFATDLIFSSVQRIMRICPEVTLNLMLSIDGFALTHDNLRKPGSFEKTLETTRRLSALKNNFQNLNLCFGATIHSFNYHELPSLAKFLYDEFKLSLECNILSGKPRDDTLMLPPRHELELALNEVYAVRESSTMYFDWLQVYRNVRLITEAESRQVVPCRAGSLICVIYANGDVRACPYLPLLGNLRKKPFQDIWHSEEALKQYNMIKRGGCVCNDNCYIVPSLANYWKLPLLMVHQRLKHLWP